MMDRWHAAGFLLQHWLRQESVHSIHSPGLYRFYTEVVRPKQGNTPDPEIEQLRKALKIRNTPIPPSSIGSAPLLPVANRTLGAVVAYESAGTKTAALLQRTAEYLEAQRILEIGTSTGLTTLYLAAKPEAEVVTIEGHPLLTELARDHFHRFNRTNIRVIEADADVALPEILSEEFAPDLVFLDANHRFEPVCRYVRLLLDKMSPGGIIAIHDIHHSIEMTGAWQEVSGYPQVTSAVNLGTMGLLLTDPRLPVSMHYW